MNFFAPLGRVIVGAGTIIRSLVMVFSHGFRKRDTILYPEVTGPEIVPPRYRGRIILSRDPDGEERCVACNLCAVACPVGCISLQKAEREDGRWYPEFFRINFSRCIFCGMCEEACPTTAIQLTPDFELGEYNRQDLVYEKEHLLISGPGKYPDYNFYRVAGMAVSGKPKGAAQKETAPVDTREFITMTVGIVWPFYLMALVAVLSTIRVVTNTNPVHGLLNLVVSLLAVAGIFFIVGAPFAGALEIIVYAGAIMVLFVFVVMMLNLGSQTSQQEKLWLNSSAWAVPALLAFLLGLALVWMLSNTENLGQPEIGASSVSAKQVGIALFGPYLLLVEIAALLLLAALVAAFHLGKRQPSEPDLVIDSDAVDQKNNQSKHEEQA